MFLATTALDEFWDKEKEILFLGPWCTNTAKYSNWKPLQYQVLSSPWDDPATREKAFQELEGYTERMLPRLSSYLNQVHNTSYSERYWRILVGPWLLHYIHILFDRH